MPCCFFCDSGCAIVLVRLPGRCAAVLLFAVMEGGVRDPRRDGARTDAIFSGRRRPSNRNTSNHRILRLSPTASSAHRLHSALIYEALTRGSFQAPERHVGNMHPHLHTKDNKGAPQHFPTFSVSID